ncbi:MAG: iron ABC transporter permease [Phycisphaeraceae bacterium]|nr:iron ABC transporter permease [Phycisphaeraceae bacterium]
MSAEASAPQPSAAPPRRTRPSAMLVVALLIMGVLVVYPALLLIALSILPDLPEGRLSGAFDAFLRIGTTPGIPKMLLNSLLWGVSVAAVAWVIGIPLGWILARCSMPGLWIIRALVLVPILTPPYVFALSCTIAMQPNGLIDRLIGTIPDWLRGLYFGFGGVTLVMALATFATVTMAVEAGIRAIPARLEDAAAMFGASRRVVAWRVTVPLLLPAILNSGLLVFLESVSNFGVPAILGPRANLPLLPSEIYHLATSWPIDFPLAIALSTLLMVTALLAVAVQQRILARSTLGSRPAPARPPQPLRWPGQLLAWACVAPVLLIGVIGPLAAMVLASLVGNWEKPSLGLTLANYSALLAPESSGRRAIITSLWLSTLAATITTALGAFTAWTVARHHGPAAQWLDRISVLPKVLPKMVMAVALILAWNAPWLPLDVYGTVWMLLVAYVVLYMSDSMRFADAGLRAIPANLERAAELAGATRLGSFVRITLPLLRRSLLAGWITAFVVCLRDLVASVLLLPPGTETIGSFIFNQFEQGRSGEALAMAVLATVVGGAVLLLVRWLSGVERKMG